MLSFSVSKSIIILSVLTIYFCLKIILNIYQNYRIQWVLILNKRHPTIAAKCSATKLRYHICHLQDYNFDTYHIQSLDRTTQLLNWSHTLCIYKCYNEMVIWEYSYITREFKKPETV